MIRTMRQRYEISNGTVKKVVTALPDDGLVPTTPGWGA
jgi:DNA-binding GntR family transcriptional regulator